MALDRTEDQVDQGRGAARTGGVLASFGRPAELKDPACLRRWDDIERRLLPEQNGAAGRPWSTDDMAGVGTLTDIAEQQLVSVETTTDEDFVARLATVSAYLRLHPERRTQALGQARAVLPDQVDLDTTVHLTLSRRA